MSDKKLNRYELVRQFGINQDIVRAICIFYNENEDQVKACLSNKENYLRICRLIKWQKQLSPEDFVYVQSLTDSEATQFVRKKSLEKKHGSLDNFYKEQDVKRKATLQQRYGRDTSFDPEKCKQTKLEKYGDENYSNREQAAKTRKSKSEEDKLEIQNKKKQTLKERYGDENYNNREKALETISNIPGYNDRHTANVKKTKLERYGDENYTNREKAKETVKNWSEEKRLEIRQRIRTTLQERYNVTDSFQLPSALNNNPKKVSSTELQLQAFVDTLNVEYRTSARNVIRKDSDHALELDIYIPSKNVAIEFDGLYWHSEVHKPNDYHQVKSRLCREKGIRLLHIYGDDWLQKQDICKSIIKASLGIYEKRVFARKCEVRDISTSQYSEFLQENHIQGKVNSSIRKGLFFEDELLQVIGLGKSRFKKDEIELHRMCTKLNTQVVGGFSKLIASLDLESFVTFVDLALFDGKGYEATGFEFVSETKPNYWYLDKGCNSRMSRQKCQKHKLKTLLGESFDPNLTEVQNMHKAGYVRFFDSGNFKLIWKRSV